MNVKTDLCSLCRLNTLGKRNKSELICITNFSPSFIKKGTILSVEGRYNNGVYRIRKGICKVTKKSSNGNEQIIKLLTKDSLVGMLSLINEETSNIKVTALNDIEVCFIPKKNILKNLKNNTGFAMAILKEISRSLKEANNIIVNMAQKTARQRLAEALLQLDEKFGSSEDEYLDIELSREDIANIIGTATESAIRLLSSFKKEKLIELQGKKIIISDALELKKIAEIN